MAPPSVVKPPSRTAGAFIQSLTPERLKRALRSARQGSPADYFALLEDFEHIDDAIYSGLDSLGSAILSKPLHAEPTVDDDEGMEQARYLDKVFDELDADALVLHLAKMKYFGICGVEFDEWGTVDVGARSYQAPLHYEALAQDWFYADKEHEGDTAKTLYLGAAPLHSYEPGSVVVVKAAKPKRSKTPDFTHSGVGMGCARLAVFRYYQPEDWAAFNETFGMPLVLGTLLKGYSKDDRKMLEEAVFGLAHDSRAVISEKTKLEIVDAIRNGSPETFERFDESCGVRIDRFIKNEVMTGRQNRYGANAAMVTTNGVRVDTAARVASPIQREINRKLVAPSLLKNWRQVKARLVIPLAQVVDLVNESRVDEALQRMGFPVSKAGASRRYGRAIAEGDDILRPGGALDPFNLG